MQRLSLCIDVDGTVTDPYYWLPKDFFIEDSYDNALQLAGAGYEVLLIDCSYNHGPILPNITRVSNWHQIAQIIAQRLQREAC